MAEPRAEYWGKAFAKVEHKAPHAPCATKRTTEIGGTDVSRAVVSDVHAAGFADEEPERNTSQQIRPQDPN